MSKETSRTGKGNAATALSAKSLPSPQPKARSKPVLKQAVPKASIVKAKNAFKNFSLSKFAATAAASNFVAARQNSAEAQRQMISQHIENLNGSDLPVHGITIAVPDAMVKKLLPSLNMKHQTIDLGEVIKLIQQNMRGTEFYANGAPALNRLAIQSQVRKIIDNVKKGGQK